MSENPFQSPMADHVPPEGDRQRLREIARYQRWVIIALGIQVFLYLAVVAARDSAETNPVLRLVLVSIMTCALVFAMAAIFLLTRRMLGEGLAILCTVLMCVPCLSLITLLVVNQKATATLQRHGVRVGFLGADEHSI